MAKERGPLSFFCCSLFFSLLILFFFCLSLFTSRKITRPAAKSAPPPFAPLLAELSKFVRKKQNVMLHALPPRGEKVKVPPAPWVQEERKAQRRLKEAERRKARKLKKKARVLVKVEWIGCEAPACGKWRQLPAYAPPASFASPFVCEHLLFIDPHHASCAVPQEDRPHPFIETAVVDCVLAVLDTCGVSHPHPPRVVPPPPQLIAPAPAEGAGAGARAAAKALPVKAESVKVEKAAHAAPLRAPPAATAQAPSAPAGIKAFLFVKSRPLPPHVVQHYTAPAAAFAPPPPGVVAYTGEAARSPSRTLPAQRDNPRPASFARPPLARPPPGVVAFTSGGAAAAPAPLAMPAHTTQRVASSGSATQRAAPAPVAPTSPLLSNPFKMLAGLADAAASSPPAAVPAAAGQAPEQ